MHVSLRRLLLLTAASCLAAATLLAGQTGPAPMRPRTDQPGPWDQDVFVYHVTRELHATPLATFPRAGVSTIARLQDVLGFTAPVQG